MKTLFLTIVVLFTTGCFQLSPFGGLTSQVSKLPSESVEYITPDLSDNQSFLAGGHEITIKGNGFTNESVVKIGSQNCLNINKISSTEIKCKVPAVSSPQIVSIRVETPEVETLEFTNSFAYKSDYFKQLSIIVGDLSPIGTKNGSTSLSKFYRPVKPIIVDNMMYVTDRGDHTIRAINLTSNEVSTLVGQAGKSGSLDGIGNQALLSYPTGMAYSNNSLFVVDAGTCLIRKIDLTTKNVETIIGVVDDCEDPTDGIGTSAKLSSPMSLEADSNFLYIGESGAVRRYEFSTRTVSTMTPSTAEAPNMVPELKLVGSTLYMIDLDGIDSYRLIKVDVSNSPIVFTSLTSLPRKSVGIEHKDGVLYISGETRISSFNLLDSSWTEIAGSDTAGNANGIGSSALFYENGGLTIDSNFLYITSLGNHNIKKMNISTKEVSSVAGSDL